MRIWSAACSTGEEPYSIAFTMLDELGMGACGGGLRAILATDISTRALGLAADGRYAAERFAGLPQGDFSQYVLKCESRAGTYQVRKEVQRLIEFRRLNLMAVPKGLGRFQVIFCRNVMIYFDQPTQASVVAQLTEHLEPGGHLFIGHAESLGRVAHDLEFVKPAVYRKRASVVAVRPSRPVGSSSATQLPHAALPVRR